MTTTRIISEESLNKVLGVNQRLEPSQWDAIKNKLRELGNDELSEFSSLMNPVIKMLSKQVLLERRAIKL